MGEGVPGREPETCEQFFAPFAAVLGFPAGYGLKNMSLLQTVRTDGRRALPSAPAIKRVPHLKGNPVMSVGADGRLNSSNSSSPSRRPAP